MDTVTVMPTVVSLIRSYFLQGRKKFELTVSDFNYVVSVFPLEEFILSCFVFYELEEDKNIGV